MALAFRQAPEVLAGEEEVRIAKVKGGGGDGVDHVFVSFAVLSVQVWGGTERHATPGRKTKWPPWKPGEQVTMAALS